MTNSLTLVFAAGVLAVLYGAAQTAVLMKASTGNDKMREIAAAIQEGASAYLKRQYLTIGIVGIVILTVTGITGLVMRDEALGVALISFPLVALCVWVIRHEARHHISDGPSGDGPSGDVDLTFVTSD